jgi:hypothetical protein
MRLKSVMESYDSFHQSVPADSGLSARIYDYLKQVGSIRSVVEEQELNIKDYEAYTGLDVDQLDEDRAVQLYSYFEEFRSENVGFCLPYVLYRIYLSSPESNLAQLFSVKDFMLGHCTKKLAIGLNECILSEAMRDDLLQLCNAVVLKHYVNGIDGILFENLGRIMKLIYYINCELSRPDDSCQS